MAETVAKAEKEKHTLTVRAYVDSGRGSRHWIEGVRVEASQDGMPLVTGVTVVQADGSVAALLELAYGLTHLSVQALADEGVQSLHESTPLLFQFDKRHRCVEVPFVPKKAEIHVTASPVDETLSRLESFTVQLIQDGSIVRQADSDGSGQVILCDIDEGHYRVKVNSPTQGTGPVWELADAKQNSGIPIYVCDGQSLKLPPVRFQVSRGVISARVLIGGSGLAGISLLLIPSNPKMEVIRATSSDGGIVSFGSVVAGTYTVNLAEPVATRDGTDYIVAPGTKTSYTVTVGPGKLEQTVLFEMVEEHRIVGTVTGPNNQPIPYAEVHFSDSFGKAYHAKADSAGKYDWLAPSRGNYSVWVDDLNSATKLMLNSVQNVPLKATPPSIQVDKTPIPATEGVVLNSVQIAHVSSVTTKPYVWDVVGLPTGVVVDSSSIIGDTSQLNISGTPIIGTQGSYTLTLTVTDANLQSSEPVGCTLTISAAALTIVAPDSDTLPEGTVNVPYPATQMVGSGGMPPYSWSADSSRPLPLGLTIDPFSGVIAGTPQKAGVSTITITLSDSSNSNNSAHHSYLVAVEPGTKAGNEIKEGFIDLQAYPVLTESISNPSQPAAFVAGDGGGGYKNLGQTVDNALKDVLSWRPKANDPKAFTTALTQAFDLQDVEGHVQFTWKPKSYTVQTDLGVVTGAQASIYTRAKVALDQSLPLLAGLYPLNNEVLPEDLESMRIIVSTAAKAVVDEFGREGGPRVPRVDQLFTVLLGIDKPNDPNNTNPEKAGGQFGALARRFDLTRSKVNTVDDEQNLTNFLIMVDYFIGLRTSWDNQKAFFSRANGPTQPEPFFGTQLVLLSRALEVVTQAVQDVYFAMDSVFLGPAERGTVQFNYPPSPPFNAAVLFADELLEWTLQAAQEGLQFLKDGGKDGVSSYSGTVGQVDSFVRAALLAPKDGGQLQIGSKIPPGYRTPRVQRAMLDLATHLDAAFNLAQGIKTPQIEDDTSMIAQPQAAKTYGSRPTR